MSDGLTVVWLLLGFGFVLIAGSRLEAGSHLSLAGLFPRDGVRDWPVGVQETDAPRFDVAHIDALRPERDRDLPTDGRRDDGGGVDDTPVLVTSAPVTSAGWDDHPEIVELGVRRLERRD